MVFAVEHSPTHTPSFSSTRCTHVLSLPWGRQLTSGSQRPPWVILFLVVDILGRRRLTLEV